MPLEALRDALPPYAADLRAGLEGVEHDRALSPPERWGCLLACALAAGEPTVLRHVSEAAAEPLGERGVEAAKAAAAVTLMNDIYYGAMGALKNPEYATLPSGLQMDALAHPGADRNTFELWCLAVSALDRCGPCMDAQDVELRRRGTPPAHMQAVLRIAAVLGAVARVLTAEAALKTDKEDDDMNPGDDMHEDGQGPAAADAAQDAAPPSPPRPAGTADPAVVAAPHPAPGDEPIAPG